MNCVISRWLCIIMQVKILAIKWTENIIYIVFIIMVCLMLWLRFILVDYYLVALYIAYKILC